MCATDKFLDGEEEEDIVLDVSQSHMQEQKKKMEAVKTED